LRDLAPNQARRITAKPKIGSPILFGVQRGKQILSITQACYIKTARPDAVAVMRLSAFPPSE
jgi:hypothetical protein